MKKQQEKLDSYDEIPPYDRELRAIEEHETLTPAQKSSEKLKVIAAMNKELHGEYLIRKEKDGMPWGFFKEEQNNGKK